VHARYRRLRKARKPTTLNFHEFFSDELCFRGIASWAVRHKSAITYIVVNTPHLPAVIASEVGPMTGSLWSVAVAVATLVIIMTLWRRAAEREQQVEPAFLPLLRAWFCLWAAYYLHDGERHPVASPILAVAGTGFLVQCGAALLAAARLRRPRGA
jgi:hypothetical protein